MTYVLLLRGINVGGHNKLPMNDLKEMLRGMRFEQVNHYIQSGNVVFSSTPMTSDELEQAIEVRIQETFDLDVPAMVLTSGEFETAVERFPFSADQAEKSVLVFLSGEGSGEWADRAGPLAGEHEQYERIEDVAYLHCPDGLASSKAAETLLTRPKSGIKATMRNWRTVNKILELLSDTRPAAHTGQER